MIIIQSYRLYAPLFFLSTLLLIGCSDKGVRLNGMVLTPSGTSASLTTGDDGTCTSAPCQSGDGKWNDSFITPKSNNSFTIAIKSAGLIKQGDTTPSYFIFDTGDIANPKIISFTPGTVQLLGTNPDNPADGTYDAIQYELTYIEMMVPINYQNTGSQQRRVRLYLTGGFEDPTLGPVDQNDILFDNTSGALNWIRQNTGLGGFIPPPKGTQTVLQLPNGSDPDLPNQLENEGTFGGTVDSSTEDPYTFTIKLASPVTVSSDNQFEFQLNFDVTKIFFFDETNGTGVTDTVASENNNNFNPPLGTCQTQNSFTSEPCDGRLDAKPKAFFWPGLPAVTATGSGGGSGTTTTTTTSTTTTT